ncbi:hypothetical protein RUND412_003906 [Rhizina undulata]
MMDSVNTNGPTEYSGTGGHVSMFLNRSFVPVSTDVSATGYATSSEKVSSSQDTALSSNSSMSASETGPSSTSMRSLVSNASFSCASGSSGAYSTSSACQGPLNLSGLVLSAGGVAWPTLSERLQPFRRPAPRNEGQLDYEEAGPGDVEIERLRAIINNVQTTPNAISGTFVSESVAESNERLRVMMAAIVDRYSFGNEDNDFTQSQYKAVNRNTPTVNKSIPYKRTVNRNHKIHYPNEKIYSRWNQFYNTFTTATRDGEMGQKREKKSQTRLLKKKAMEKIKNDCYKAEKMFGAAIRRVNKLTWAGKAMAAWVLKGK